MTDTAKRCIVCRIADPGSDTICPTCKAMIRAEAYGRRKEIKSEADRALSKKGTDLIRKKAPLKAA